MASSSSRLVFSISVSPGLRPDLPGGWDGYRFRVLAVARDGHGGDCDIGSGTGGDKPAKSPGEGLDQPGLKRAMQW